ncbi:MAG: cation:proton antiporter [Phycisphaerales bacterium]|nr:cation:proton antiporter [Phycisphaerales bacterium]
MTLLLLAQQAPANIGRDLLLVLATAGLTALVLSRFRVTTIPGYLIAGALIGPYALGFVHDAGAVQSISQLSTILLLFTIGLQLDMAHVRAGLFSIVGGAVLATVLMTLLAWPVAYAFTGSAPASLAIAMACSIAATAAPLRMLEDRRALHTTYGRVAFGITLFQDLLAVVMLGTLPVMAHWAGHDAGAARGWTVVLGTAGRGLAGLTVLIVSARVLLPRLLAEAGRVGGEVLIVVSAAIALGSAVLTAWLGFSPELGAFLAGFLLASTPFRYQVAGQLTPMRDLFLAVFFTSIGLALPIGTVIGGWWIVLISVVVLAVIKIIGVTFSSWALGAAAQFGFLAALVVAPAGEFTLVVAQQAAAAGVISQVQAGYVIAVVVMSIIVGPGVLRLGSWMAPLIDLVPHAPWFTASPLRRESDADGDGDAPRFRSIVAGFGPVGRAVADSLSRGGVDVTVVELNARTVQKQAGLGRSVVYGDASNVQVLESAGLGRADAVILTMPDEEAMLRACRVIRSIRPDIFIAARANALSRALQAMQLGADHAVVEEMVTAEAMASQVLLKVRQRIAGEDTGPKLYAGPRVVR